MSDEAEARMFFFRGMVRGWANGTKPKPDPNNSKLSVIEYEEGPWHLTEAYVGGLSAKVDAWGYNFIMCDGEPVWHMVIRGWHERRAERFLKGVFRNAYRHEQFYGGRGESGIQQDRDGKRLVYVNTAMSPNSFVDFRCNEIIAEYTLDRDDVPIGMGTSLGWHECSGGFGRVWPAAREKLTTNILAAYRRLERF